ncbi:hypothetical protein PINS_up011901 [Pythium insidiosum]|nr:hypothetical protein PINS_up011901 [Pythium insidiosum]
MTLTQNEATGQRVSNENVQGSRTASITATSNTVSNTNDDDEQIALYLSGPWFCFAWWIAFLCHAGCAAFLVSTTAMYVFLADMSMFYYNKLLATKLNKSMEDWGFAFTAMAIPHFWQMLKMVYCSCRQRQLAFRMESQHDHKIAPSIPESAQDYQNKTSDGQSNRVASASARLKALSHNLRRRSSLPPAVRRVLPPVLARLAKRLLRLLLRIKRKTFHRKEGLLGIESPYFYIFFLLRESVEIASQSYQMYQASRLLSSVWINALFLAITVVNCWSTPLLQHALAHYSALERVICLALDAILDAGTCLLIPLVIVFKYIRAFDRELLEFPPELLNDPEWFVSMILENRMLFAMDKVDLFSKLVPHHSLYGCINKVKELMYRMPAEMEIKQITYGSGFAQQSESQSTSNQAVQERSRTLSSRSVLLQRKGEMPGWKRRLVHTFFIGWGVTILVVHLRARKFAIQYEKQNPACKQNVRPWFSSTFMCATYVFDCVENGNAVTMTDENIAILDPEPLSALVIANCPQLVVPSRIQTLSNMLKFMIYNSTIASWSAEASINNVSHPEIISICIVSTNMTAVPDGLLVGLPMGLQDIQFAQTNLTSLPEVLPQRWQRVTKLLFEYCNFSTFPTQLLQVGWTDLSLVGNRLVTLPDSFSARSGPLGSLSVSDNTALTSLPASGLRRGMIALSIENTAIAAIPDWVYKMTTSSTSSSSSTTGGSTTSTSNTSSTSTSTTGSPGATPPTISTPFIVYAHNTPYCATLQGSSPDDAALRANSALLSTVNTYVFCSTRDPSGIGRFPLSSITARYRPQT